MQLLTPRPLLPRPPYNTRPLTRAQGQLAYMASLDLARKLHVAPQSVTFIALEPVEFTDASLGFQEIDGCYQQCLIDGHIVRYMQGGKQYEFHTISTRLDDGLFGELPRVGAPDFWRKDERGIFVADTTEL